MLPFIVNINYRTLPSANNKECGNKDVFVVEQLVEVALFVCDAVLTMHRCR